MGTKEDWEEVERTYQKRENEMKDQYGMDITKVQKDTEKTRKKILKANKSLDKLLRIWLTILAVEVIGIIVILILSWKYAKNKTEEELRLKNIQVKNSNFSEYSTENEEE